MGRRPKLFLPVDVGFMDDERIVVAGDGPAMLYLAMCLKSKATGSDGRLGEVLIRRLNRPKWKTELATLAELQLVLWDDEDGRWCIAAWFSHNEPVSQIEARRAADRDRKREEAERRRQMESAQVSGRNPGGFHSDSGSQREVERRKEKEREGNPRAVHAFIDDGQGCCEVRGCGTLPTNSVHLRAV